MPQLAQVWAIRLTQAEISCNCVNTLSTQVVTVNTMDRCMALLHDYSYIGGSSTGAQGTHPSSPALHANYTEVDTV